LSSVAHCPLATTKHRRLPCARDHQQARRPTIHWDDWDVVPRDSVARSPPIQKARWAPRSSTGGQKCCVESILVLCLLRRLQWNGRPPDWRAAVRTNHSAVGKGEPTLKGLHSLASLRCLGVPAGVKSGFNAVQGDGGISHPCAPMPLLTAHALRQSAQRQHQNGGGTVAQWLRMSGARGHVAMHSVPFQGQFVQGRP